MQPLPPPKGGNTRIRAKPLPSNQITDFDDPYDNEGSHNPTVGAGYNAARLRSPNNGESANSPAPVRPVFKAENARTILDDVPETTISEQVVIKGFVGYSRLLRIDGLFSGVISSTGDLIIGKKGRLEANVSGLGKVVIDGKVVGDIQCDYLDLRANSFVHGNITCKSLKVDGTATIVGTLNVHPQAPDEIDKEGNLVSNAAAESAGLDADEDASPETSVAPQQHMSSSPSSASMKPSAAPIASPPAKQASTTSLPAAAPAQPAPVDKARPPSAAQASPAPAAEVTQPNEDGSSEGF